MRPFWGKFFTFLIGAILVFLGVELLLLIFGVVSLLSLQRILAAVYFFFAGGLFRQFLGILLSALFLVAACLVFRLLFLRKKEEHLIFDTGEGKIRISFSSIKALSREAVKDIPSIVSVEPQVESSKQGTSVVVKLLVKPDTVIPELSSLVQNRIREQIERQTGIALRDVRLFVDLAPSENVDAVQEREERSSPQVEK
ncbi:MAG: alkaline shock response membrane anchor protein AmaP [Candidatus Atribacteria bacterium]|nr:alkaline shock response membrane anchor protein AmaP [Candidatus Atribacteria bacterium]MCD6349222.1 alkaline shock response membrane anchor protein AmaP [Candidatus Atribacteria bacterium]